MQSNLEGRLRNFKLDKKDAPFCIFETVINGFQSYADDSPSKLVRVEVCRELVLEEEVKRSDEAEIESIVISDNGRGFNDENFNCFKTLDETTKPKLGCKGVGRLTWLKIFELAEIESVYSDGDKKFKRSFKFSAANEVYDEKREEVDAAALTGTTVKLSYRKSGWLEGLSARRDGLMLGVLSHCLKYFVSPDQSVDIEFTDSGKTVSLRKEFKKREVCSSLTDGLLIKGHEFQLSHLLLKDLSTTSKLAWCANKRVVKDDTKGLKDIPKVLSSLQNSEQRLVYICLIESSYLDEKVRQDRTDFLISEKSATDEKSDFFEDLDFATIKSGISGSIQEFLNELIKNEEEACTKRKEQFTQENPSLKALMDYCWEELEIGSKSSDKEIKKQLRRKEADYKDEFDDFIHESKEKLASKSLEDVHSTVEQIYSKLMSEESAVLNRTALSEYVIKRKAILMCFEKALEIQESGKYQREDFLHNLIVPMRCDSDSMYFWDANLWLIDDRLAFHNYIASDIKLKQIKIADLPSDKRPDITTLALTDYSGAIGVGDGSEGRIEIVEFKRPMRDDIQGAFPQLLEYARKLADSKITSYKGRPVRCNGPVFGYIVSDMNKDFEDLLINTYEFKRVDDGFLYKPHKADTFTLVVEALSYDYLLKRAKQRNQAFFTNLGIPF